MDENSIEWVLDEENSNKKRAILRWGGVTLRVTPTGQTGLYNHIYSAWVVDFPDLAELHRSIEDSAMPAVLSWFHQFPGGYEGGA